MADGRLLAIYLNDHLAGATVGIELARRSLRANRGTELGRFLEELLREIEDDRRTLESIMDALRIPKSAVKPRLAVVAERVGRLKLNGQLTGYSPLSRVLELEGLTIGVAGKLSLWRNLRDGARLAEQLPGVDLDALIGRAERQLSSIAEHRVAAARVALAPPLG
ncbi:MAG TPA: hypothetical protein VHF67_00900 [Gaiellaceae bacterium]|nr:hypothetical protein [Gaiellaceae bacterium]